jgi:pimeloyl-ACP methyl ester carboxylesterase
MRTVRVGGREIAVQEWGDPAGRPVFYLHGTPSSRLERCVGGGALGRLGVRLITYDRPGYGRSTARPDRTVGDAAGDVAAVADALGVGRFAVYGASGGGPHALACAALLADRVDRAASVAGVAPFGGGGGLAAADWMAGMAPLNVDEFGAALVGRPALEAVLKPQVAGIRSDPAGLVELLLTELPAVDAAVLGRPDVAAMFTEASAEAVALSADGWIDDDLAFTRPWGFAPADIAVPVLVWHGELDVLVPVGHSALLAGEITGATLVRDSGAGHLGAVDAHPAVLAWLLGGPPPGLPGGQGAQGGQAGTVR